MPSASVTDVGYARKGERPDGWQQENRHLLRADDPDLLEVVVSILTGGHAVSVERHAPLSSTAGHPVPMVTVIRMPGVPAR